MIKCGGRKGGREGGREGTHCDMCNMRGESSNDVWTLFECCELVVPYVHICIPLFHRAADRRAAETAVRQRQCASFGIAQRGRI